jgi:iron complex outermembrane receptor protein
MQRAADQKRRRPLRGWPLALAATAVGLALTPAAAKPPEPAPAPTPEPAASDDAIVVEPIDVRARRARPAGVVDLTGADPTAPDAARALDEPATVTVVRVADRAGEAASVAEVLAKSVGVDVRTLGGLGAFAALSVRGAAPAQTAISIDGVPLSKVASATADLGAFEIGSFAEVEIYRGGVPVELGGAALGGAVNFVTGVGKSPNGHRTELSLGVGSFGARHGRVRWRDDALAGALGTHVTLGYRAADGDYEYFNDNGTSLNLADDGFVTRQNNGFRQVDAAARARYRRASGTTVEAGTRALWKRQGVPGLGSTQSTAASLTTLGQLVDVRVERARALGRDGLALGASAFGFFEDQRYTDRLGEIGLGTQDARYRTLAGGVGGHALYALGAHQVLSLSLDGRVDDFDQADLLVEPAAATIGTHGGRHAVGAALADEIAFGDGERLILVPGLRVDGSRTDPGTGWSPITVDPGELGPRTDVLFSPRLAVRARVVDGVALKASAGRYFRTPTLVELFGDRGFVVGNPVLAPETGVSGDVGWVVAPARATGPLDRLYWQGAFFSSRAKDAIVLQPTAGLAATAKNLGAATIYGFESALVARLFAHVTFTANYTFMGSRQDSPLPSFDGKRLPLRPRHHAYARVDAATPIARRLVVAWADIAFTSGNMLDAANTSEVPARRFVGAGLKLALTPSWLVAVEAKNLLDERVETIALSPPPRPDLTEVPRAVADFLGYPLPGRAFYLTLDIAL